MKSGSARYPYIGERFGATGYDRQIKKRAAVFLIRKPLQGDLYKNIENLKLEMACVKAERFHEDDNSGEEGKGSMSNGDNGEKEHNSSESQPGSAARPALCTSLVSAVALIWVSLLV
ncbi:uncharacterized protein MCYG_04638 [Microsporum canis CBS 113480]|uniref:Uncharacterized protein n=1 Tax=Arthroderma otae (strain ATCC MYA-4605 / CBS 113480) TaxID=554155 RepID=C5FNW6_ARTOC|nr:uncharacterized protein MCYG_04638 [Microsporum canis CBS 113480]EEQ31819.1 predicted protein [Microsporum canis CBS 113480]